MRDIIRMIVADDHPLFLEGVIHSLQTAGDMDVLGRAADAPGAVRLAQEYIPDVALLDLMMPGGGGLQAARDIKVACPATKIVMLTVSEDEDNLVAAMKAGASGYVLKGVTSRELTDVIRSVYSGQIYVAPRLAGGLLREMTRERPADPLADLTPREREVLQLVATGLSNLEIGGQLGLAEKTIKQYMTNILSKLQVRSRVEAALLAVKLGSSLLS